MAKRLALLSFLVGFFLSALSALLTSGLAVLYFTVFVLSTWLLRPIAGAGFVDEHPLVVVFVAAVAHGLLLAVVMLVIQTLGTEYFSQHNKYRVAVFVLAFVAYGFLLFFAFPYKDEPIF